MNIDSQEFSYRLSILSSLSSVFKSVVYPIPRNVKFPAQFGLVDFQVEQALSYLFFEDGHLVHEWRDYQKKVTMSSEKISPLRKTIAQRIKYAREFRRLKPADMRRKIGLKGPSEYPNIEKGKSLTVENLLRICKALDINFMWLITGDEHYKMEKYIEIPDPDQPENQK